MSNSTTINNSTFIKHSRLDVMSWGDYLNMTDAAVYAELERLTGLTSREDIDQLAAFVCLNRASMSFDYPAEDFTRALLGAFHFGYVSRADTARQCWLVNI